MDSEQLLREVAEDDSYYASTRGEIVEDQPEDLIRMHRNEGLILWKQDDKDSQQYVPIDFKNGDEVAQILAFYDHALRTKYWNEGYAGESALYAGNFTIGQASASAVKGKNLAKELDGQPVRITGELKSDIDELDQILRIADTKIGIRQGQFGTSLNLPEPSEMVAEEDEEELRNLYEKISQSVGRAEGYTAGRINASYFEFRPEC